MKRNLSVTTAAAALLIGTVFAAAQGVQRPGGGAEGGAQTVPSEGKSKAQSKEPRTQGQGQREGQQQQPKTKGKEQAQPKEPRTQGQGQREQGQREGQQQQPKTKGKEQAQPKEPGQGQRGQGQREGQQQQPKTKGKEQAQPKEPQGQGQREQQGQRAPQGQREGQPQQGSGDTQKSRKGAEGKAATEGGDVKLTTDQRTKVRSTVLQGGNAPRVSSVDFSVSVGTVVPRERVKLVAVPSTLVEIRPAWRGYLYFVVGERIIIVEPSSYRIVAVLVV